MKNNPMKLSGLAVALLALSACIEQDARTANLQALSTPKIQRQADGTRTADRMIIIPFRAEQPCTKDIFPMARFNPHTNSIEMCAHNQWNTAFVSVAKVEKDTLGCKKKSKQK